MMRFLLPVCLCLLAPLLVTAQDGDSGRFERAMALERFLTNAGGDSAAFVKEHADEELRTRAGIDVLAGRLDRLRKEVKGASLDDIFPDGDGTVCFLFASNRGDITLMTRLAEAAPYGIVDVWLEGGFRLDPNAKVETMPPPLTWDGLADRMADEEARGFAGVLVIVRDGETIFEEAYGMANREAKIACTPDTIFAIGSTPIDFTKAGILLLAQDGALTLDQPITDFFEDVPEDKRSITIRHLMTGGSGLRDFHGLPTDGDPDHAWIDREEAVARILDHELLFAPGTGSEHSHSAWGLLAAILEIVSGSSYQDFTRELLFEPAGLQDTGFFGDPIPKERLAIGYGDRSDGEVNAPPYWGETSWLVMGSGGMVSTTGDMLRWMQAIRAEAILKPEWLRYYWAPPGALLAGGDMYGFEIVYTEGPETQFVLLSNAINGNLRRRFNRLARELATLR